MVFSQMFCAAVQEFGVAGLEIDIGRAGEIIHGAHRMALGHFHVHKRLFVLEIFAGEELAGDARVKESGLKEEPGGGMPALGASAAN